MKILKGLLGGDIWPDLLALAIVLAFIIVLFMTKESPESQMLRSKLDNNAHSSESL